MTRYLSVAEVVAINAEVVRKLGGTHAIRDAALLDSAVRGLKAATTPMFLRRLRLCLSLSQNHPFVDRNKRTATATGVFLLLNCFKLLFNDLEAYEWLIGLYQAGKVSKANIEPWLREHAKPL